MRQEISKLKSELEKMHRQLLELLTEHNLERETKRRIKDLATQASELTHELRDLDGKPHRSIVRRVFGFLASGLPIISRLYDDG